MHASLSGDSDQAPVPLSALVGRDRELTLARSLIRRPDVRLLTLTGPGGIGKTRLALQLAADLDNTFTDGVRFVSLASVQDAGLVAGLIARTLDVQPAGAVSAQDALSSALKGRNTLLVIDNFEQVLPAAPVLTTLLSRCPFLTILVTSRALLRVAGEHALAVPPLTLPDPRLSPSLENLAQSSAIQLFVERAQSVDMSFALTELSAPQLAEICRRVDGLPLAIELVAPRIRHLALPDLLDRLSLRLPLLTGGSRDQPTRLQTMRSAIAWSYDLLSAELQAIFRSIAVFANGFSLESAEAVIQDACVSSLDISALDGLAALIDASLLQAEIGPDGGTRYRMLETIREFGLEQQAANDEAGVIRRAHADCFLRLAERFELADWGEDGDRAISLLEREHANFRAALVWLAETGEHDQLAQLAARLGRFWLGQGHYVEGRTWLTRSLSLERSHAMPTRASALVSLGMIELFQGAIQEADVHLTEGLAGCRAQGQMLLAASALIGLGGLANNRGDLTGGAAFLEEARIAAQDIADRRLAGIMAGWALINLAVVTRTQGDLALAVERLEEALELERQAGYTKGTILALGDLGDLARDRGDHQTALAFYQEALGYVRDNPGTREATDVVEAVAIAAVAIGHAAFGSRLFGATEAIRERIGLRFRITETQAALEQAVVQARSALGDHAFAAAWAEGRALSSREAVAEALQPMADLSAIQQPTRSAGSPFAEALTPREQEILLLMAEGLTDPAIAERLFLSVRTVENHVRRILAKTGVRTRTAAVATAIAAGFISPEPPPGA